MTRKPKKPSLKGNTVADRLRQEILSGALPENTPLRQAALAHRFRVSIIPVREAIATLVQEGLAEAIPFRGAVVARLRPEELLQIARVRIALEHEALALAHAFHTQATLEKCRGLLAHARLAKNNQAQFEAYLRYLEALYEPSGHPFLVSEIMRLVRLGLRYSVLNPTILRTLPKDVPMPLEILSSLATGDLGRAQRQMRMLYTHTSILGASVLYQRDLEAKPKLISARRRSLRTRAR